MEDRSLSTREVGILAITFGPSSRLKGGSSHSFDGLKDFEAAAHVAIAGEAGMALPVRSIEIALLRGIIMTGKVDYWAHRP